ncbi:hypothetical protein DFH06DRAFT_1360340 [Mycena polygramma]|nr:hypothetical protein DFH06DRAFT_1360340 [Mycena polygramma]
MFPPADKLREEQVCVMSFELPPELWLRILEHLPWLTIPLLRTVSAFFATLSYGLLFEEFQFTPTGSKSLAPKDVKKLAFWSSEHISCCVRRCHLVLPSAAIGLHGPSPLVSDIFDAVSRFSGLRLLTCRFPGGCVDIPALRLEGLSLLKTLQIHGARLICPTRAPSTLLKAESFSYTLIPPPPSASGATAHTLTTDLSFLDPAALCHLRLQAQSMLSIEHFLADKAALSRFHSLRVLDLGCDTATVSALHAYISLFPALRELAINLREWGPCKPARFPLPPLTPHLHTYAGPAELLPLLLSPTSGPHTLTLLHNSDYTREVLRALQAGGATAYPSVTSLSLQMGCTTICDADETEASSMDLTDILACLPRLSDLQMKVWCGCQRFASKHVDSREFCEKLARLLRRATALKSVQLQWSMFYISLPHGEDVQAALFAEIPSLK